MRDNNKIAVYDLEGNFLQSYKNKKDFCDDSRVDMAQLIHAIKKRGYVKSFQVVETDKPILNIGNCVDKGNNTKRPCAKYWKGNLIAVYKSQDEAMLFNNLKNKEVSNSIHRGTEYLGGFVFEEIY